jgi:hypothetical protein
MFDLIVNSNFGFQVNHKFKSEAELYIDVFPNAPKKRKRILCLIEPWMGERAINYLKNNKNDFDLILCWQSEVLNNFDNSKLFPFGTSWIKNFDLNKTKEFCVTTLIGSKNSMPNHKIRHDIPNITEKITSLPIHIFNSKNKSFSNNPMFRQMINPSLKNELFYSQFHIAIENVTLDNWFTEKLIDCFQTKTVPIYIGCNNISDFFDVNGIIHAKNLDDLIDKINKITPRTYDEMKTAIEKNYLLSNKYCDFEQSIINELYKIL